MSEEKAEGGPLASQKQRSISTDRRRKGERSSFTRRLERQLRGNVAAEKEKASGTLEKGDRLRVRLRFSNTPIFGKKRSKAVSPQKEIFPPAAGRSNLPGGGKEGMKLAGRADLQTAQT